MRTYIYKTSVNIGYVIDYIIKERKSLNGADSTIYIYIQSTPDHSNLQGKLTKVRVIGS